jgi:DNA topoisomerase-3
MSKTLVIAEKPSVAQDIVRALTPSTGKFERHDEYHENAHYVVTSAIGHLVEIAAPEAYEVKRGKWSFAHLPVIPPHFDLQPIDKTKGRLAAIAKLIRRKDIGTIVNACDAGREGELIFRLIVQYAKAKQPIQRLWLQSMTPQAIREGFERLRSDAEMLPLAEAARCRSEADWLVGINGTRAMTAFNSKDGGFFLTTVGRVQTPTLAIVVEREEQIRRHVARDYFELRARFGAQGGEYEGRWFDPQFKKNDDAERRPERLWRREDAEAIAQAVAGKSARVSEETKPSPQAPPALFDLTSLQREANGRFGFSAKATLALAQALYEKHKALTYPRTDSRALPEDYLPTVRKTFDMLAQGGERTFAPHAALALERGYVVKTKRVFDNAKVSDHFAIIPTLQAPKGLSEPEAKLYELVVKRFIAVFYPSAEYLLTTRLSEVAAGTERHLFKTEGKVLVDPGWLAVYGKEAQGDDATLPAVAAGETPPLLQTTIAALRTKPPARYNEATLLSAMENAGKRVEDEDLAEAMSGKGLGTPATRASIIEGLLLEKYMLREGRDLIPTAKAFQLMTLLRGLAVEELTKPELTGEWEYKLAQMERGQLSREAFMREIAQMTQSIVKHAKDYDSDTIPGDYATLQTPCPNCGGIVKENYRRYQCSGAAGDGNGCGFSISKTPAGRAFELDEIERLLREREIGPLDGFRSKMGRPFASNLKLVHDAELGNFKLEFDWGQQQDEGAEGGEPVDFSGQEPLGACPKCSSPVYAHGTSYVCERQPQKQCDFRSGQIILQQPIERAQMHKLLTEGRTDLLHGFVSARTRRKFSAFLVKKSDGSIGFAFEPRAAAGKSASRSDDASAEPAADGTAVPRKGAAARKAAAPAKAASKTSARAGPPRRGGAR